MANIIRFEALLVTTQAYDVYDWAHGSVEAIEQVETNDLEAFTPHGKERLVHIHRLQQLHEEG